MSYTNMKCPECGKERTMLPEWEACGICRDEGEELGPEWYVRNRLKPSGYVGPGSKLTDQQIKNIRRSKKSTRELARQYKVSPPTVWKARTGKTYKQIKPRVHEQYPEELPIGREGAGM